MHSLLLLSSQRIGGLRALLSFLLGLLCLPPAFGQGDSLQSVSRHFARYSQQVPPEKLFLHLDRPAYVSGETMWFKLYSVEGTSHRPLAASTVAYVEVVSQARGAVLQTKVALRQAAGQGSLVLPAALPSGHYTVRAYTNWMKNFGPELYFQSPVTIINTRAPLGLPAEPAAAQYDAQFFPEGGYLVQGLTSKVGFKITDQAGRGVAAEGTVLDQAGTPVAQFRTLRFGLGSFSFQPPKAGAAYRAVIRLAGNLPPITCPLPPVKEQGYVLRLVDTSPTKLRIVVQTRGAALAEETLFLLGHAQSQVSIAAEEQLFDGQVVFTVDKQKLAAGISHFTLFNSRRQPVAERLYFRPPKDTLGLTVRADKSQYGTRQKVTLQVTTTGPGKLKLPTNLSVAVYQLDSLSAGGGARITSYLWLTSDLKGTVESPDYYVSAAADEAEAADNLMLTQGWSRFRWSEVLADKRDSLVYPPELSGHRVRGRVLTRTGEPAAGVPVYLTIPSRRVQLYNSLSRPDGSIQFEVPEIYGSQQLILQADPTADSLHQLTLVSPFSRDFTASRPRPWRLPSSWSPDLQRRLVQAEVAREFYGNRPVRYQAPPADSTAFYGQPNERYFLDRYTRFKVMEEVMREYVPGVLVRIRKDGFHFLVSNDNKREKLENPLVLLDGMPVFNINRIMAFDPLKVERLDVITRRYLVGPLLYNGVVSYSTYHGDLGGFPLDPHALLMEYEGLQGQRDFYAPRYDTPASAQSRLPDFRNLLYWNPQLTLTPGAALAPAFYTSDQAGTYRVVVQGLNGNGQAGSASFTLEVKPTL